MSFEGKVVIVTGSSSGIGAATAIKFSKEGAKVTILGRNETGLKSVSKLCENVGKKPLTIQVDITNDEKLKDVMKKVIEEFGKLDILVNNAGVTAVANLQKGNLLEAYDRVMNTNLRAAIHLTMLAVPYLIETRGNIVNVSSSHGSSYLKKSSVMPYAISKAGLDHFTRGAALELLSKGVRVNTVSPGLTKTNIFSRIGIKRTWEEVQEAYNQDRVLDPEEVAELICFVASDKAKGINGANYMIDNGALITC